MRRKETCFPIIETWDGGTSYQKKRLPFTGSFAVPFAVPFKVPPVLSGLTKKTAKGNGKSASCVTDAQLEETKGRKLLKVCTFPSRRRFQFATLLHLQSQEAGVFHPETGITFHRPRKKRVDGPLLFVLLLLLLFEMCFLFCEYCRPFSSSCVWAPVGVSRTK